MTLRILQIEEAVIGFFANNTLRVLHSFSYHTKVESNNLHVL